MKERKTSKAQVVAIILLTLLLIGNCAYICYDKIYLKEPIQKEEKKEQKEKTKKKEKKISRKLSFAEEKILLSQIDDYNAYLADAYPIKDIKDLPNQQKLLFAYALIENKREKEILQSELKKWCDAYFGKDHDVAYEDITCFKNDGVLYHYNDSTRIFTKEEHGHEGMIPYESTSYLIEGTVENETQYILKIHTIYQENCPENCERKEYYKNLKDAKIGQNAILTKEGELGKSDYEKVKDRLEVTTFTFKKDTSGNYGLQSVT